MQDKKLPFGRRLMEFQASRLIFFGKIFFLHEWFKLLHFERF
jgi:hypothetical protein